MTRRRPPILVLRAVATLGVAVALCGTSAAASRASALPDPVGTAVGGLTSTVTGATAGLGLPVPTVPAPGSPSTTATGSPTSPPVPSSGSSTAGGGGKAATPSSTGPSHAASTAGTHGAPANGAVVDSPAATVCLIPTGGASPAVRVDLTAAGVDLSSPLVKQFPQALAPCPAGAVPAGDHVLAVDANVQGLLGACVRVTRQVAPVQTTLVVLDHDVIKELTAAGVPLDQLVVPCPGGGTTGSGAGAPGGLGAHQSPGHHPGSASALPAGLAFTGGDPVPMAVAGVGLLWLGVVLTRAARSAVSAGAVRG